jgi:hypothetical protein
MTDDLLSDLGPGGLEAADVPLPDDVRRALDTLAGPAAVADPAADPAADLERARFAARRRAARRVRFGALGVAAACLVGVTATGLAGHDQGRREVPPVAAGPAHVELVASTLNVDPYTFDLTPRGWSVQGQSASAVTIAPDRGGVSGNPDDFQGKLVILYDENPLTGERVEHDGRAFYLGHDSGYTMVASRTLPGEPAGVIRVQYPDAAGWDRATMLDFLGSVHVSESASPGVG